MVFKQKYINNTEYERHKLKYGSGVTIRFNDEETDLINKWQDEADIQSTGEAVKSLMKLGFFVTHGNNLMPVLSRLFKKERARKGGI